ncbi:hypothetical protein DT065_08595 [Salicibibacter kimchii]|uniref:DUF4083 domain-containing protein n=1 Tax=Salicibibacter kimchii TaxID=2099786 RepID=A0A345BYP7_9BACI|nr:hypothetical protein DT065_08595 [Salicibibacter kimchii]
MEPFSVFIYTICVVIIGSFVIGSYATVKHYQTRGKTNDEERLDNIESKVDQIMTEVRNKDNHSRE